jgi:hypothetical protein
MRQVDLLLPAEIDLGCPKPIDGRAFDPASREKRNQLKVGLWCCIDAEIQQNNSSDYTYKPKRPKPGGEHDRQERQREDESHPEAVLSLKSIEVGVDLRLTPDEPSSQVSEVLHSFVDVLSRVDQRVEKAPSHREIPCGAGNEHVRLCLFERKPEVSLVGRDFLTCTFTDDLEVPEKPVPKCLIVGEALRHRVMTTSVMSLSMRWARRCPGLTGDSLVRWMTLPALMRSFMAAREKVPIRYAAKVIAASTTGFPAQFASV